VDPVTGLNVYAVHGRFGAYVQLGETPEKGSKAEKPKRASLQPPSTEATVTIDEALRLLDMPRTLGAHPADGEPILANFGRYGPYVKHGEEYRSLEPEDDVFTIALARALELLAAPKKARRRQASVRTVLAELGPHPETSAPVRVLSGRYGPYVTDGTTNASLPRGMEPPAVTLEIATGLLAARAGAAPSRRRGARRSAAAPKRTSSRGSKKALATLR
jgi:DNA topoisomerase-1